MIKLDIYLIRNRQDREESDADPIEAVFLNGTLAEECYTRWNKKERKENLHSPYYMRTMEISGIDEKKERMYADILKRIEAKP